MNRLALFLALALVGALVVGGGLLVKSFLAEEGPRDVGPIAQPDRQPDPGDDGPDHEPLEVDQDPLVPERTVTKMPDPEPRDADQPEFNVGQPGVILGRVVDAQGSAVAGATIELAQGSAMVVNMPSLRTPTDFVAESDGAGQFRMTGIPPAEDYLVVVEHNEHGSGNIGPFELLPGAEHDAGEIKLRRGGSVRGFVTYSSRGIGNAVVRLESTATGFGKNPDKPTSHQEVKTDGDGYYSFETVSFKNFQVTVEAEGYGRQTKSNAAFLEARVDQEINFDLTLGTTISGFVFDKNRRGIGGATVLASLSGASFRSDGTATCAEDGSFLIESLAEGQYHLNASAEGFSPANKPKIEGGTANVELEMQPQGSVAGIVMDESGTPLDKFSITALRSFRGREPSATGPTHDFQGAGGQFIVAGLDPNTYVLEARAPGFAACRSEEFSTSRGEVTEGVVIHMDKGGSVSGRVVDSDGSPVRNVRVSINTNQFKWNPVHDIIKRMTNERGGQLRTKTDADGNFQIDLIVPGVYQVAAEHPAYSTTALNDIEIGRNRVLELGEIYLNRGAKVDGFCYDENGLILAGASVTAVSAENDYFTGRCNSDGHFVLSGLPAGDYTVSINNYVSDPPENVLLQMLKAKNSAKKVTLVENSEITLELRLSTQDSGG